jgi:hypothetical protein
MESQTNKYINKMIKTSENFFFYSAFEIKKNVKKDLKKGLKNKHI